MVPNRCFFSAAGTGKAKKKTGSAAPVSLAEGDGGEAKKGAEFGAVSAFAMGTRILGETSKTASCGVNKRVLGPARVN